MVWAEIVSGILLVVGLVLMLRDDDDDQDLDDLDDLDDWKR